jgi:hypothetical protein
MPAELLPAYERLESAFWTLFPGQNFEQATDGFDTILCCAELTATDWAQREVQAGYIEASLLHVATDFCRRRLNGVYRLSEFHDFIVRHELAAQERSRQLRNSYNIPVQQRTINGTSGLAINMPQSALHSPDLGEPFSVTINHATSHNQSIVQVPRWVYAREDLLRMQRWTVHRMLFANSGARFNIFLRNQVLTAISNDHQVSRTANERTDVINVLPEPGHSLSMFESRLSISRQSHDYNPSVLPTDRISVVQQYQVLGPSRNEVESRLAEQADESDSLSTIDYRIPHYRNTEFREN